MPSGTKPARIKWADVQQAAAYLHDQVNVWLAQRQLDASAPPPVQAMSRLNTFVEALRAAKTKSLGTFAKHRVQGVRFGGRGGLPIEAADVWRALLELTAAFSDAKAKGAVSTSWPEWFASMRRHIEFVATRRLEETAPPEVKVEDENEPLSDDAAEVYEMLLELPPHRAMLGPEIVKELNRRHPTAALDESQFRKSIVAALRPYGIENKKRIGYRIKPSRRPA